ncbi:alpha/beta hydrolase [Actinoplanes couchii]|uniref:DUF1023 domain-containing protein n=1 Tax=Actinoplanes couchii TaxID=403638 RepID=A0ABQ3XMI5_9ACTN|nr:alpha/beta hydrolase [Actinoplanes couchii]MDR6321632.1 putative esterase [Actinoplanes couchii]GID59727.1 hypothetical protein Aco03nite_081310 [Actinoplanes couchii]
MSAVTLQQLLNADPGPWHAMASGWRGLADRIDDSAEEFIRGTRDLAFGWPVGDGAQAAEATATRLRAEVSNSCNPARRIFDALDRHAHAVSELRQTAEEIVAAARRAGLIVDVATGAVRVPPTAADSDGIVADLGAVVERARALDESTTTAIRANLPAAGTGFGRSVLPGVTRGTVEAQRGRPPADVRTWWEALTPQQQEQAIREMPDVVGWLDGVPATDRDLANRIQLGRLQNALAAQQAMVEAEIARVREELRGRLFGPSVSPELSGLLDRLDTIRAESGDLGKVERKLAELGADGMLLGIDGAGDGKVVMSVGNPDTARHTAVWVPGVGTDLGDVSNDMNRVVNIHQLAESRSETPGTVAAIMWLGYDAPELNASAVGYERSEGGGAALDRFTDGLRATHTSDQSHLSVIGHSYGSTVVAEAALDGNGLAVDDIIAAGSPGMHTDEAADLGIDPRHVWAGQADGDHIAGFAGSIPFIHGNEPSDADFGANRFVVDTEGHSAYWERDSQSLNNQVKIILGRYEEVGLEHGKAPTT